MNQLTPALLATGALLLRRPGPQRRYGLLAALVVLCGCSSLATQMAGGEGNPGPEPVGSGAAAGEGGGSSMAGGSGVGARAVDTGPADGGGVGGGADDAAPGAWLPEGTQIFPIGVARPDAPVDADAPGRDGAMDASASDLRVRRATRAPEGAHDPSPDGRLCGNARHTLARTPAELLVVLDRSTSMGAATTPGRTRWDEARDAVVSAVGNASNMAWGLKWFPSPSGALMPGPTGCDVDPGVEVGVGFGHAGPIGNALMQAGPPTAPLGGFTPTAQAILAGTGYLQTVSTALPKYLVLVTDGDPSCEPTGSPQGSALDGTLKAMTAAAAAGFETFVIGIVAGAPTATLATLTANLNRMADAGGMPRAIEPRYYPAENQADLEGALQAISVAVTSCVFPLATRPLDPDFVGVTVGSVRVPRDLDRIDGWDYVNNGTAIEIYGADCDALRTGAAQNTDIHFGCPD